MAKQPRETEADTKVRTRRVSRQIKTFLTNEEARQGADLRLMMSSVECFAQAEKLDETARNSIEGSAKSALVAAAKEWRQLALAAQAQEAWEVLHEDVLEKPSGA